MNKFEKNFIVVGFFGSMSSGCDYATQTIKILARKNTVIGLRFGEPVTYKNWFWSKDLFIQKDGVWYIRPVFFIPGRRFVFIQSLNYQINAFFVRLLVWFKYSNKPRYFWFFEPYHIPVLLRVFHGYTSIYDCVDYFAAFSQQAKVWQLKLLERADCVFANSHIIVDYLRQIRVDAHMVPLGFADELFADIKISPVLPKRNLIIGFVGSISNRIDFSLLTKVIQKFPEITFHFVGPIELDVFQNGGKAEAEFALLRKYKNIVWTPGVSKNKIPRIIQSFDIGLIPYRVDIPFNKNSFPMKIMEYFALGKPVISTDIAELRQYEKKTLLTIVRNVDDFMQEILDIQHNGWNTKKQGLQKKIAASQSWEDKLKIILSWIEK